MLLVAFTFLPNSATVPSGCNCSCDDDYEWLSRSSLCSAMLLLSAIINYINITLCCFKWVNHWINTEWILILYPLKLHTTSYGPYFESSTSQKTQKHFLLVFSQPYFSSEGKHNWGNKGLRHVTMELFPRKFQWGNIKKREHGGAKNIVPFPRKFQSRNLEPMTTVANKKWKL